MASDTTLVERVVEALRAENWRIQDPAKGTSFNFPLVTIGTGSGEPSRSLGFIEGVRIALYTAFETDVDAVINLARESRRLYDVLVRVPDSQVMSWSENQQLPLGALQGQGREKYRAVFIATVFIMKSRRNR